MHLQTGKNMVASHSCAVSLFIFLVGNFQTPNLLKQSQNCSLFGKEQTHTVCYVSRSTPNPLRVATILVFPPPQLMQTKMKLCVNS